MSIVIYVVAYMRQLLRGLYRALAPAKRRRNRVTTQRRRPTPAQIAGLFVATWFVMVPGGLGALIVEAAARLVEATVAALNSVSLSYVWEIITATALLSFGSRFKMSAARNESHTATRKSSGSPKQKARKRLTVTVGSIHLVEWQEGKTLDNGKVLKPYMKVLAGKSTIKSMDPATPCNREGVIFHHSTLSLAVYFIRDGKTLQFPEILDACRENPTLKRLVTVLLSVGNLRRTFPVWFERVLQTLLTHGCPDFFIEVAARDLERMGYRIVGDQLQKLPGHVPFSAYRHVEVAYPGYTLDYLKRVLFNAFVGYVDKGLPVDPTLNHIVKAAFPELYEEMLTEIKEEGLRFELTPYMDGMSTVTWENVKFMLSGSLDLHSSVGADGYAFGIVLGEPEWETAFKDKSEQRMQLGLPTRSFFNVSLFVYVDHLQEYDVTIDAPMVTDEDRDQFRKAYEKVIAAPSILNADTPTEENEPAKSSDAEEFLRRLADLDLDATNNS